MRTRPRSGRFENFSRTIPEGNVTSFLFKLMFGDIDRNVFIHARNVASPGHYNTKDYSPGLRHTEDKNRFEESRPVNLWDGLEITASRFRPTNSEDKDFYLYAGIGKKNSDVSLLQDGLRVKPASFFIKNLSSPSTVVDRCTGFVPIETNKESVGELHTVTYANCWEQGTLNLHGVLMTGHRTYIEYMPMKGIHGGSIDGKPFEQDVLKEFDKTKSLKTIENLEDGKLQSKTETHYDQNLQESKPNKQIVTTFAYPEGSNEANQQTVETTLYDENGEPSCTETSQYSFEPRNGS